MRTTIIETLEVGDGYGVVNSRQQGLTVTGDFVIQDKDPLACFDKAATALKKRVADRLKERRAQFVSQIKEQKESDEEKGE